MDSNGLTSRLTVWLKKPYSDDMSVTGWFLFLGLLGVLSFLWSRVLHTITKVA